MAYRIGELSYISGLPVSLPLHTGMIEAPPIDWVVGLPAELDEKMERGELDASPISSLEYIRRRDRYTLVPDLGMSSWGRIGSAVLFSKLPFSRLSGKRVALSPSGATSNVLLQWLLHKSFGVEAHYEEAGGELAELLERYDAALLIGDQAVAEARKESDWLQLDLGESWWHVMKTPMVHTVWVVQAALPEARQEELFKLFGEAKAAGKAHHDQVVAEAAKRLGMPTAEVEAYYALLNYDLAPVHMQSMNLFGDFVQELATH